MTEWIGIAPLILLLFAGLAIMVVDALSTDRSGFAAVTAG